MDQLKNFALAAKSMAAEVAEITGPPEEGLRAPNDLVILSSLVRGTRGYIEKIGNQINGTYANGWFDSCAVMIRRLVETLIIESFEKHGLASKIKNSQGDFFYLRDLISQTLNEPSWNLSRNCKAARSERSMARRCYRNCPCDCWNAMEAVFQFPIFKTSGSSISPTARDL